MLQALVVLVGAFLAAGLYALVTTGPAEATHAASGSPGTSSFGFALAAGAVALAVTLLVSRPRLRLRR